MGERIISPTQNVFKQYRKLNLVNPYIFEKSFVSTWKTDNLSTGSTIATQVKLPTIATGTYACTVDWGDGITTSLTTATYNTANTHIYAVAGIYPIKITGTFTGIQFNNTGDRLKILSVQKWGSLRLGNSGSYFYGCANLNLSAVEDVLNLTGTTTLVNCFRACTALTTVNRIGEWNISNITTIAGSFRESSNFNQNLNSLDVSSIISFTETFQSASAFNNGLASGVSGTLPWTINTTSNVTMASVFQSATSFNCALPWNMSKVTTVASMFQGASNFNQNLGVLNLPNCTNFTSMFNAASKFNNGGSNSINSWTLNTVGNINMTGIFNAAVLFNQPVDNWNMTKVTNTTSMFNGASAFNQNLSNWERVGSTLANVTNTNFMFFNATAFNGTVNGWNCSRVIDFTSTFNGATSFNNGLTSGTSGTMSWTINSTTNTITTSMFSTATSFNQDISSWNMSKVSNIATMFYAATKFNQNLSSWTLSICTSFAGTFNGATIFNNGLASGVGGTLTLNTSVATTVSNMFLNATAFNQDLGVLNLPVCTAMDGMLQNCSNFNNGLASGVAGTMTWALNTSTAFYMANIFAGCSKFNQNIGGWNVTRNTSLVGLFSSCTVFNNGGSDSIKDWVTINVTNSANTFTSAIVFNQPLNWNMVNVTSMNQMFQNATAFNQDIGAWDIRNVVNFSNFMLGKTPATFSTANLDAIYNGWSTRPVKPSIVITFGTAKYTAAGSAGKAILQGAPNLWNITDGGI